MTGQQPDLPSTPSAQESLFAAVRARILGFATYLGCGDEAEDIAQQTLLVLHERYSGVADPEELLKLSTRISANLVFNWRRHKSNPSRSVELSENIFEPDRRDPEYFVATKELRDLLLRAIETSDHRCKELLRLRLMGANTKDIAQRMKMTVGSVDTAYFRCLQRLRDTLRGNA